MMRYIVPALLLVFLIPVLWSFFPTEPQILQLYEPTSQTFGVGFDLGASYGTVAVSYPNGTIQSIAKVVGDAAYLEVMSRLSLQTSQHLQYVAVFREEIRRKIH
ncbi:hypothetical protein OIDMADRAFT_21471 [Oidiodendron maius Zn]|uniref:Carbohydrate kinase FGGY N-terminal domain-containing protein n=1 Tax=Oidiodendron maius (strain Zn) TaxID=913774 RepID=A0A0C3GCS0_OIDMZ|nr:hypothetical protein OIDMADRAFT_21471 [Oidiodendron maius Zn]